MADSFENEGWLLALETRGWSAQYACRPDTEPEKLGDQECQTTSEAVVASPIICACVEAQQIPLGALCGSGILCVHMLDDPGLRIVASSSHLSKETEEFVSLFDSPEFVQVGSSLKMIMVAEGLAHMYPRCGKAACCLNGLLTGGRDARLDRWQTARWIHMLGLTSSASADFRFLPQCTLVKKRLHCPSGRFLVLYGGEQAGLYPHTDTFAGISMPLPFTGLA
eukprot:1146220-Pelagomonas_calceolata.AAC.2